MFEKFMRAAERAADGVSRREFFGRLGRGAAVAAGVVATAGGAQAGGVCGADSSPLCRGKREGAACTSGRYRGKCYYATACICRF